MAKREAAAIDTSIERIPSEVQDSESSPPQYEIATYPADFTLQVLHNKWRNGEIQIPEFQRQFVWTQVQASKLIESFLLGLPVPSVFFYTERRTEKLLVIDGQQRLKTVFYYFDGYFGEEIRGRRPVFRLVGLNERSRWYNKSFEDLQTTDEASANRLRNAVMRSFVVKQLDPNDDTSVYHIFERLNTGGTLLAGQEIRNCVYAGTFNELLKSLNQLKDWRQVFGMTAVNRRMRDVELILRFFALYDDLKAYQKPMKEFLSSFMRKHQHDEARELTRFESLFKETVNRVLEHLGPKPFHVRAGLNSAVFDAVFVGIAGMRRSMPSDLKKKYLRLLGDKEFNTLTTSGTTDVDTIKRRIEKAKRMLA